MPTLTPTQYLVPARDHSYEVCSGRGKMVSEIPVRPVSYSANFDAYFEYFGDEYLEGDEVKVYAPVLDDDY